MPNLEQSRDGKSTELGFPSSDKYCEFLPPKLAGLPEAAIEMAARLQSGLFICIQSTEAELADDYWRIRSLDKL
jgi:hypothetical protein